MGGKEKKHKKEKKKKKKRKKSSSSESGSSGDEMWVEKTTSDANPVQNNTDDFSNFLAKTFMTKEEKKLSGLPEKNAPPVDDMESTITDRELNPYWKTGNKGLPDQEAESNRQMRPSSENGSHDRRAGPKPEEHRRQTSPPHSESVPSEKNFRRGNDPEITDGHLNKLEARILKAELMDESPETIQVLKDELEQARLLKRTKVNSDNTVVMMKTGSSGISYPVNSSTYGGKRARGKIETHDKDGKRSRYFGDDDGQSMQDMVLREKSQTAANQNAALLKLMTKTKGFESLDDMFVSASAQKKSTNMESEMQTKNAMEEQKAALQTIEDCALCFNSRSCKQRLVVEHKQHCYISIPVDTPLVEHHCLICPVLHQICSTLLDEEVFEQMEDCKKQLAERFSKLHLQCIFIETFRGSKKMYHMAVECVPVSKRAFNDAPMFFKKAIMESEEEWSLNNKLVPFKNNDIRRTIPKGLSYFSVQFGPYSGDGYAHVIEDINMFPRYFAREVLGGIMNLDDFVVKRPKVLSHEAQYEAVANFKKQVLRS